MQPSPWVRESYYRLFLHSAQVTERVLGRLVPPSKRPAAPAAQTARPLTCPPPGWRPPAPPGCATRPRSGSARRGRTPAPLAARLQQEAVAAGHVARHPGSRGGCWACAELGRHWRGQVGKGVATSPEGGAGRGLLALEFPDCQGCGPPLHHREVSESTRTRMLISNKCYNGLSSFLATLSRSG